MAVDGRFNGCCPRAQRAAVELHARSVGAEVIAEFQDVESGRKADRTGLAAAEMISQRTKAGLAATKVRCDFVARTRIVVPGLGPE